MFFKLLLCNRINATCESLNFFMFNDFVKLFDCKVFRHM